MDYSKNPTDTYLSLCGIMGFMNFVQSLSQFFKNLFVFNQFNLSFVNDRLQSANISINIIVLIFSILQKSCILLIPTFFQYFFFKFLIDIVVSLHRSKSRTIDSLNLLKPHEQPHPATSQLNIRQDHQKVHHINSQTISCVI